MEKVSAGSLRVARTLVQSITSPALRPTFRFMSSTPSSYSSTSTALRRSCAAAHPIRLFSSTSTARNADRPPASDSSSSTAAPTPPRPSSASLMEGLADLLPSTPGTSGSSLTGQASTSSALSASAASSSTLTASMDDIDSMKNDVEDMLGEFHLAIYAHKHNTHVTFSKPNGNVIMSMSTGNIGFKRSHRGTYDAAYQLGAATCDRMYRGNWHKNMHKMRVTLRGFGPGREAITKVLLGQEGKLLRTKITRVADTTRLKFGGTRSPRPRRLG
ncbi:37S ribosomal protein S11 [Sporothrix schenckii 1099-18]|uniref:Ribosomal protein S11 n=2 Tax=Sporothrix schenckii TaxID=29908 RepID=U7PM63_SPOS1|nr:37S ribosomal protein S11 [Sporothrix schenckii 1099-18]ERS96006.1 hypothetical protein HMPREF1624_07541 [Sporothrix schenckii ATCC 58251]KJR81736.1 37S ribosomal protein S11 [Sporothrix schenckii 1099-18]